ncbi:MAG: efflux RND transporter periplasmic adaptor subunit [Gemmatimonadaceae bacterium]|nr:efflux RND transporter periplasmic adaptor subunit [Gemmatimonadaceae bacterium]
MASAALALSVIACGTSDETAGEPAMPLVAVTTAIVSVEPMTRTLSAIGSVVGRPGHQAALSAPAPTRISRVYVAEGERVTAGQPLVEFEQAPFDAAAAASRAALAAAQRNQERAQRLANEGILPRKDVEAAAAELAKARSDALVSSRAARLSVLRSPMHGVITRMVAVLGAAADAGQVLVEIADPRTFDVVLALAPAEASAVLPGRRVELSSGDAIDDRSLGLGIVESVGAIVDSGSRSVQVRVHVATPVRALRLGESVTGSIAVEVRADAVVVPVEALVPTDQPGRFRVFVVDPAGIARAREVTLGGRTSTRAEILSGLRGGERVVTTGAYGLADSARVSRSAAARP